MTAATLPRRDDIASGSTTQRAASSSVRRRLGLMLALLPFAFMVLYTGIRGSGFDFEIYRNALTGMLHGGSVYTYFIYQPQYATTMGFVYPPFASLVLLPLAIVPDTIGKAILSAVTAALVVAALICCFRIVDARRQAAVRSRLSLLTWAWVSIPMAIAIPTVSNMQNGQVSFAIAALMLLDVTVLPRRWRGVLVGLVGAIKLTPMILIPYFLVTRQWRAALNASIAFGAAAIVSAAFRWSDSVRYWLHPDVINNSLGDLARWDNWSINGDLSRLGLTGLPLTLLWGAMSALVIVAALWRARRHFLLGQGLEATLVMGIAGGLVTAATWPHHLLFLLIACALLAVQRPAIGIPALVAVMVVGYLAHNVIGFCVVPLMVAFVIFGVPGFPRPARIVNELVGPTSSVVDDPVPEESRAA